ncbi:MAG: transposase family protein, partial [Gemmataceae bacterium]|nr:transposase family protein [Gemmataceae bacterium]
MIARLVNLRTSAAVFRHLTGLTVAAFDELAAEVVPAVEAAHRKALDRPDRQRAVGGGDHFDLTTADQVLLTVIWLRQYPTNEVLGFLFGVSDSTASRARTRCLPVLEKAGRDTMRMPDPGVGRRKKLSALLADTPGLAVVIDSFEQRTQRPKRRQRAYYSGKKKAHTLKTQVAVDEHSGRFVDVSDSVPGRWADIKLLETSRLMKRLPEGVGGIGDLGYTGIRDVSPSGACPRRKPRGQERPPEDRKYNRA